MDLRTLADLKPEQRQLAIQYLSNMPQYQALMQAHLAVNQASSTNSATSTSSNAVSSTPANANVNVNATPVVNANVTTTPNVASTPAAASIGASMSQASLPQYSVPAPQHGGNKYTQLLALVEELSKDIRPTYTSNRNCTERLKRGIMHARNLVRECLTELDKQNRMAQNSAQQSSSNTSTATNGSS